MLFEDRKILLVAAHPDDIESGCGGTVAKCENCEIQSIVFAPCLEDPLNIGIISEFDSAMKVLGVARAIWEDFPRDILEQHQQEIRDVLHRLKETFDPSIILCPSTNDLHQDHRAIAGCCHTIFRDSATLLNFELIRSSVDFKPNLYVGLSEEQMKQKLKALKCYKTQYRRAYFKPSIFLGLARSRGSQIDTRYAEAFEVTRMTDK